MTCYANRHTFMWGSSTVADETPLSLSCECGAVRREDIVPIQQLQQAALAQAERVAELEAEIERLTWVLRTARGHMESLNGVAALELLRAALAGPPDGPREPLADEGSAGEERG
jgi:hypothetical protein